MTPFHWRTPLPVEVCVADEERSNEARFTSTRESLAEVLPCPPEARKPLEALVHHGRYGTPYVELEPGRTRAKVVGEFRIRFWGCSVAQVPSRTHHAGEANRSAMKIREQRSLPSEAKTRKAGF